VGKLATFPYWTLLRSYLPPSRGCVPYWYRNVDVRVGKAIGAARGHLVATVDVFNVFNTANHSDYRSMQNQPDYGLPIGDYARRQAQIGMRYQF
jgi:hypothetical protein